MGKGSSWAAALGFSIEIVISVALFAFLGYMVGKRINEIAEVAGLTIGAISGLAISIYRAIKEFE
ncbi:MAG: hypothetical protein ACXQS7_05205 [Candidatus Syntropharchaeia archaeon]